MLIYSFHFEWTAHFFAVVDENRLLRFFPHKKRDHNNSKINERNNWFYENENNKERNEWCYSLEKIIGNKINISTKRRMNFDLRKSRFFSFESMIKMNEMNFTTGKWTKPSHQSNGWRLTRNKINSYFVVLKVLIRIHIKWFEDLNVIYYNSIISLLFFCFFFIFKPTQTIAWAT